MSADISCKKIIKNNNDIIIFDDDDLVHAIFGIVFIFAGLTATSMAPPSEKIENWLFLKLGFSMFIIIGISSVFGQLETIAIDRRMQSVNIKSRRLFIIKGKDRTIKFSDILYPSIKENDSNDGPPSWDIILTLMSGETKQVFRGENHEEAEGLLNKIYAFLRGNEVNNAISTSEVSTPVYSLHHQTLSLEQGWGGKFIENKNPK